MPKTRRRLQPESRRFEILKSAERLLRRRGMAVRVDDIVREARAAKGTFYLYFATWDDLLEALRSQLFAEFDAAHPLPDWNDQTADWGDRLEQLACAFVDFTAASGGLHDVLFHSDFAQRRPLPIQQDPISRLVAIIKAGQQSNLFAKVDAQATARLLFAIIHETLDAVVAGEDRRRAMKSMRWALRRILAPEGWERR